MRMWRKKDEVSSRSDTCDNCKPLRRSSTNIQPSSVNCKLRAALPMDSIESRAIAVSAPSARATIREPFASTRCSAIAYSAVGRPGSAELPFFFARYRFLGLDRVVVRPAVCRRSNSCRHVGARGEQRARRDRGDKRRRARRGAQLQSGQRRPLGLVAAAPQARGLHQGAAAAEQRAAAAHESLRRRYAPLQHKQAAGRQLRTAGGRGQGLGRGDGGPAASRLPVGRRLLGRQRRSAPRARLRLEQVRRGRGQRQSPARAIVQRREREHGRGGCGCGRHAPGRPAGPLQTLPRGFEPALRQRRDQGARPQAPGLAAATLERSADEYAAAAAAAAAATAAAGGCGGRCQRRTPHGQVPGESRGPPAPSAPAPQRPTGRCSFGGRGSVRNRVGNNVCGDLPPKKHAAGHRQTVERVNYKDDALQNDSFDTAASDDHRKQQIAEIIQALACICLLEDKIAGRVSQ
uniref:Uncharacterized protein n=1 Tax=Trichogramma kaykai TaxID=54128 RepID=A0ABD2XJ17_9HYME